LKSEEQIILLDELKKSGINNENVLNSILKVKREKFVLPEYRKKAYINTALPIICGQTISQPYTVAFMTQLLDVKNGDKVLEVGTGSGYQSAVLCELGANVFSVERINELFEKAKNSLADLNYNVNLKCGDGCLGWKEYSPFDKIIVTAGTPSIPAKLILQLKINGLMVVPVGDRETQEICLVKKVTQDENSPELKIEKFRYFCFVPLISEFAWKNE
jgi:protein-L-isoaspartate(D-aspartate) O-methyltransferase